MKKGYNLDDFNGSKEDLSVNLEEEFDKSIIDLTKKVERPPVLVSIGLDPMPYKGVHYPLKLFSRGNISLITGEEKSRKSFVKSLIEACSIGGKANNFDDGLIKGYIPKDQLILSIDAEQSTYDVWLNGKRIPEMVGAYPNNYKILKWREKSKDERLKMLDWIFMESSFKDKIGLVILDGYVDFIKDFNSLEECGDFAGLIMKYSSLRNCHISGVLHLNPNSEKARGHAGTILSQKAEIVINVKNMGDYSVVKCKSIRGSKSFEPFTIRVNSDWLPYISNDSIETNNNIGLS